MESITQYGEIAAILVEIHICCALPYLQVHVFQHISGYFAEVNGVPL